jgi:uncharacterized protein
MPINAHPEFTAAEGEYLKATTLEEKIEKLKKMISYAPAHKGGENLRAQLKTRLRKLQEQQIKQKKSGKSSKIGIKKEDMQAVIIGKTNSGKSSLLNSLTKAQTEISSNKFTTITPKIGMMHYQTVSIQLVEIPPLDSEFYDKGIVYTSDTVLIVINSLEELKEMESLLRTNGKKIIIFNKIDLFSEIEKRKIFSTLQSKKYNFVLFSSRNLEGLEELKERIFKSFEKLRVYTKEPGKESDKHRPMILPPESTVKDVSEKILKGFSSRIKQIRIWGPSSKFPGQIVGLNHKVKDSDIVEFKTK